MEKRQNGIVVDDDHYWYYSPAAVAVKWAVLAGILLLVFGFFIGGYLHAQRRMKKGMPPLAYHRWFIARRQRARFEPHLWQPQNQFSFYHTQDSGYNMHPVPPPAYNPDLAPPPVYQPPAGASKVDPSQQMDAHPSAPNAPAPAATATHMPTPAASSHA